MAYQYRSVILALWVAWLIYWGILALNVKAARRRESLLSRAGHGVPLLVAAWLLITPRLSDGILGARFLPAGAVWSLAGTALVLLGLAFTVWARVHLGRNWSGIVTVKQGHELIRSGPYRWVRHPIYTGLLLAFMGSAIALGQWRGVLAMLIVFAALWRKLRLEERWMIETFGAAYTAYRNEVAALIPFVL
ncbi:isoprenylcysteine carboxylmethyltransferase family protein [Pandoraea sp.]|uniref:methyltransferase family protein n=1 Tax=Pandoraea sp. TaxID=1883445 RepID=UPI001221E527|nr:isoprenylcysteine carboxylmethyltransferase family protein [Pandoraea sp.]TAL53112.1 MAG: isoprenylcysteine carboxylmethyltransferase family protein [Pandoraea sp.]TAM20187.1 MAG: isoprenylcysteine carboxylmethyltransferase family protein [Pandoraea sp.]